MCANEDCLGLRPTFAKDLGQMVPDLIRFIVVITVGKDMVDGPRVHSKQPVALKDHHVQHRR